MKKILSLVLAMIFLLSSAAFSLSANASQPQPLHFNKNGDFTILHLSDVQDDHPISETVLTFVDETLKTYKPDLVILGGDNTVNSREASNEDKAAAVKQLCDLFVANEQKFTLVFGNHDRQQILDYTEGLSEEEITALQDETNDKLLALYKQYGGEYCYAYDAEPELHGSATHALPVYKSDNSTIGYVLYMFDSGENTVSTS